MLENLREAQGTCPHVDVDRRTIKSEFFKREFAAEVDQCRSCGVQLWTPDTQARFNTWILGLKQERRDVFQLQVYVPDTARNALADVLARFPGVPTSALMRVMTTVYLSSQVRYPEFKEVLRRLIHRPAYQSYIFGRRRKTSVQFSPMALLDIQSWGEILKMPPHKILEDAVFKLLALNAETEPGLREFWEKNILPQIELILRAV